MTPPADPTIPRRRLGPTSVEVSQLGFGGATIGGIVIGAVTAFTDFPTATIVWVIVLLVYQQIENNVLTPKIQGKAVNLSGFFIIVAVTLFGALLGVLGALVLGLGMMLMGGGTEAEPTAIALPTKKQGILDAPLLDRREHYLGIGVTAEGDASLLQLRAKLPVVVDLTVEDDHVAL